MKTVEILIRRNILLRLELGLNCISYSHKTDMIDIFCYVFVPFFSAFMMFNSFVFYSVLPQFVFQTRSKPFTKHFNNEKFLLHLHYNMLAATKLISD